MKVQGLTDEQHAKLGDFVVWDAKTNAPKTIHHELVGARLAEAGIDPQLDIEGKVKLANGTEVEVSTAWTRYEVHLKDYDLDTGSEITAAPKDLIERMPKSQATIKHATL